jgi:acyl-CoA thioesterase
MANATASGPEAGDDDRLADRKFFGLTLDASGHGAAFNVADAFSNPRGTFYGGAGVAVAVAMMEAATERRALWTTLQFLGEAWRGDRLELTTDVRAHGNRTSQVRVTALQGETEVFTAIGATGVARDEPTLTFERMPAVRPPDDCEPVTIVEDPNLERSRFAVTEHRVAADPIDLATTATQVAFWARVPGMSATPALLAYVGDAAALGLYHALDRGPTRATSLDNTLRVGPRVDTEWVLLDVRAHSFADGYGHGTVHLWSPGGTLLAMVSQTLAVRSAS